MKTIKFRGKSINKGKWLFGDLMHDNIGGIYIFPIETENLYKENAVTIRTIGQYTGLKDINGVEIYEGDIIFSKKYDCKGVLHKIEYSDENAMFIAKPIQGCDFDFCQIRQDWILKYEKEVIGNIYDNPEILK